MSSTLLTTSSIKLSTTTSMMSSSSFQRSHIEWRSSSPVPVTPSLGSPGQPLFSSLCLKFPRNGSTFLFRRNTIFRCNNILPTDSGENESKNVLDAFFLGKAFAEVVNERVESSLGEIVSIVGKIQADNQKYVQEFQEEVVERAKRAQEKASQEAMATLELIPKTSPEETPTAPSSGDPKSTQSNPHRPSQSVGTDPLVAMLIED